MDTITDFFQKKGVKRVIIFGLIILILFSVRSMMNLNLAYIYFCIFNGSARRIYGEAHPIKPQIACFAVVHANCRLVDIWACEILTPYHNGN